MNKPFCFSPLNLRLINMAIGVFVFIGFGNHRLSRWRYPVKKL